MYLFLNTCTGLLHCKSAPALSLSNKSPKKGNKKQGASERNKYKIQYFFGKRPKKGKISICFQEIPFFTTLFMSISVYSFHFIFALYEKRIKKVKKNYKKEQKKVIICLFRTQQKISFFKR